MYISFPMNIMNTPHTHLDRIPTGIAFNARAVTQNNGSKIVRTYQLNRDKSNDKQILANVSGTQETDIEDIPGTILDTKSVAVRFLEGADKQVVLDLIQFGRDAKELGLTDLSLDTEDLEALAKLDNVEKRIRAAVSAQM